MMSTTRYKKKKTVDQNRDLVHTHRTSVKEMDENKNKNKTVGETSTYQQHNEHGEPTLQINEAHESIISEAQRKESQVSQSIEIQNSIVGSIMAKTPVIPSTLTMKSKAMPPP